MTYDRSFKTFGFAALGTDEPSNGFDQRSRQELVRDDVVFAPSASPDSRLADAIRELTSKKVAAA